MFWNALEILDMLGLRKVIFLKCIGDSSAEASALMKREGVRSVPSFHVWKDGSKVDTISGARIEDVEAAIKGCM